MSDRTEFFNERMLQLLDTLDQQSHASFALAVAAAFESRLELILRAKMPNLHSKRLREKLFNGYGPLASFSAKIDILYALDTIPNSVRHDLHVLRELRNEFAHAVEIRSFRDIVIIDIVKKFNQYKKTNDHRTFFRNKLNQINKELRIASEAAFKTHPAYDGT